MKHELKHKVCMICHESFTPDPRVGDRQKVCNKTYCKLQRKKLAQQHWVRNNPGYFKGRYPQLKEQILANHKRTAQAQPPAYFRIPDKLMAIQNKLLTVLETLISIQDEITRRIVKSKYCLPDTVTLVYKTS